MNTKKTNKTKIHFTWEDTETDITKIALSFYSGEYKKDKKDKKYKKYKKGKKTKKRRRKKEDKKDENIQR